MRYKCMDLALFTLLCIATGCSTEARFQLPPEKVLAALNTLYNPANQQGQPFHGIPRMYSYDVTETGNQTVVTISEYTKRPKQTRFTVGTDGETGTRLTLISNQVRNTWDVLIGPSRAVGYEHERLAEIKDQLADEASRASERADCTPIRF